MNTRMMFARAVAGIARKELVVKEPYTSRSSWVEKPNKQRCSY